ncbi:MAG TPA: aerolysin family beta-barrel pore-forming toxin [Labilithrix sp.]|nr:aerolysin family beta-barrel pore-forming toxin [Labilithrix sp.]
MNRRAKCANASEPAASQSRAASGARSSKALSFLPYWSCVFATLAVSGCVVGDSTAALEDVDAKADELTVFPAADPSSQVVIYRGPNFTESSQVLSPGVYDSSALKIGDNALSSLKVPAGWQVFLYQNPGFTGKIKRFAASGNAGTDFNDITSSIVVQGPRDLGPVIGFTDVDFRGAAQAFKPGVYNVKDLKIGNDRLSSLRIPAGWSVTLWENQNFGSDRNGNAKRKFTGDVSSLSTFGWNDRASSLIVNGPPSDEPPAAPIDINLVGDVDAENLKTKIASNPILLKNLAKLGDMLGFGSCGQERSPYVTNLFDLPSTIQHIAKDYTVSRSSGDSYVMVAGSNSGCKAPVDQRFTIRLKNFRFVVDPETFVFEPKPSTNLAPIVVAETLAVNGSNTASNVTVSLTDEHTEELSHTTETSITAGIEVSVSGKAGVPFLAEGSVTTTVSFSAGFGWSNTTTTTDVTGVTVQFTARVPAKRKKVIQMLASRTQFNVDYQGFGDVKFDIELTGVLRSTGNGLKDHPVGGSKRTVKFGNGSLSGFEHIVDAYDHANIPNFSDFDWDWISAFGGKHLPETIRTLREDIRIPLRGSFRSVKGISTSFQEGPALPL